MQLNYSPLFFVFFPPPVPHFSLNSSHSVQLFPTHSFYSAFALFSQEKEIERRAGSLKGPVRMRKIAKSSRFSGSVSTSSLLSLYLSAKSPTLCRLITQIGLPGDEGYKNEEGN